MNTHEIDGSIGPSRLLSDDAEQPFLEVEGIEGSSLRATRAGLTVYQGGALVEGRDGQRRSSTSSTPSATTSTSTRSAPVT